MRIGLTVLHRVVKAQGGDVEVTSQPGRGTIMILTLPGNLKSSADAAQHRCTAANSVVAFLRSDSSGVARQCQADINWGTLQVGKAVGRL